MLLSDLFRALSIHAWTHGLQMGSDFSEATGVLFGLGQPTMSEIRMQIT